MRFEGRMALVSGASGSLGRAVAARLADEGARLVLLGRDAGRTRALAAELGEGHRGVAVDYADWPAVAEAVGAPDVLCACAGGFAMGPKVHETTAEDWRLMFEANLGTLLPLLAAAVPGMLARGRGRIVTVGAHAALKGVAGMGPYCAAKSAVLRATESAAAELRGKGINVNAVLPTIIDTPANRAAMPKADPAKWVSPERLAAVVAFLASDEAADLHGALVPVTGLS